MTRDPARLPSRDSAAFREYLTQNGLAERWNGEATRIDSAEIRRSYPGLRFYYTYSREPLPPGAPSREALAAYNIARAEYQKRSLQITVAIDDAAAVRPFRTADDFNRGLVAAPSDEETRIAAAAIISLMNEPNCPPSVITADKMRVEHSGDRRVCRLQDAATLVAEVEFDASGKCVRVRKQPTRREVPR